MHVARKVAPGYDFSKSTEENYSSDDGFVGKFAHLRGLLDYSYHKHYKPERQLMQDDIMDLFNTTVILDGYTNGLVSDVPTQNWLVFMAGPMGAGKSHTLVWLAKHGYFPLHSFVRVDADAIREILPETKEYIKRDIEKAGLLTQKEVGYICELLILYALQQGKNVLVDGSLRDFQWYKQYIQSIREQYRTLRVAILHVTASEESVYKRAAMREAITGRHVPESILKETMEKLPNSVFNLAPFVDKVITFWNDDVPPPATMHPCSVPHGIEKGPYLIDSLALSYYNESERIPASILNTPRSFEEFEEMWVMRAQLRRRVASESLSPTSLRRHVTSMPFQTDNIDSRPIHSVWKSLHSIDVSSSPVKFNDDSSAKLSPLPHLETPSTVAVTRRVK